MTRTTVLRSIVIALVSGNTHFAAGAIYYEIGDANQLPATAQGVTLSGSVEAILGSIENGLDADLYSLLIDDPPSFSAKVVASEYQAVNPQLFLFDEWGHGVVANDDGFETRLPHLPPGSLMGESAGSYLLGISAANCDPRGLRGDIFANAVTGLVRPEGLARFYLLEDWRRDFMATGGDYAIALTGVMGILPVLSGDFDEDGDVDGDDLSRWQAGYGVGTLHTQGDADGDLDVDGQDFLAWQRQYGRMVPLKAADVAVLEPASFIVLMSGILAMQCLRVH